MEDEEYKEQDFQPGKEQYDQYTTSILSAYLETTTPDNPRSFTAKDTFLFNLLMSMKDLNDSGFRYISEDNYKTLLEFVSRKEYIEYKNPMCMIFGYILAVSKNRNGFSTDHLNYIFQYIEEKKMTNIGIEKPDVLRYAFLCDKYIRNDI